MIVESKNLKPLYDEITKNVGKPLDKWEITALLEIYGIRDIDAQNEYGFDSVFELAEYLTRYIETKEYPSKSMVEFEKVEEFWPRVIKNYIRGLAFAMPMLVQIFFTLTIGYAIWSGMGIDTGKATVIAIGTFLALIITGGFAQSIGRKGLFYLKQKEYILASNVTKVLLLVGIVVIVIFGIGLTLFNLFFEVLPPYYFFIMISFYFLLSILFLNVSVYYMFEEYSTILYYFIFGVFTTYIFHSLMKIALPEAQFLSLLVLDTLISVFVYRRIIKLRDENTTAEGDEIPRYSILFYSLMPFYTYGTFFFLFLVADRVVAWSVNVDAKPYFIWFNVPYELGLDWALVALILMMGFSEVAIHEFMYRINEIIVKYRYYEYQKFNNEMFQFFKKFNLLYALISTLIIFLIYFIILFGYKELHLDYLKDFFQSFTPFVYWISAISYAFLVNALINVLFIFSFSRQNFSLNSVLIATFFNIMVGMILSRMISLEYAVIGLLVGSIVFWIFSFKFTKKMLKRMDFYYYSAF